MPKDKNEYKNWKGASMLQRCKYVSEQVIVRGWVHPTYYGT